MSKETDRDTIFEPRFEALKYNFNNHMEMLSKSTALLQNFEKRRSIRNFSQKDVPLDALLNCVQIANLAPSGANKQPWKFVIVKNQEVKDEIRQKAEAEEKLFYSERAPQKWLDDLKNFGTNDKNLIYPKPLI